MGKKTNHNAYAEKPGQPTGDEIYLNDDEEASLDAALAKINAEDAAAAAEMTPAGRLRNILNDLGDEFGTEQPEGEDNELSKEEKAALDEILGKAAAAEHSESIVGITTAQMKRLGT